MSDVCAAVAGCSYRVKADGLCGMHLALRERCRTKTMLVAIHNHRAGRLMRRVWQMRASPVDPLCRLVSRDGRTCPLCIGEDTEDARAHRRAVLDELLAESWLQGWRTRQAAEKAAA